MSGGHSGYMATQPASQQSDWSRQAGGASDADYRHIQEREQHYRDLAKTWRVVGGGTAPFAPPKISQKRKKSLKEKLKRNPNFLSSSEAAAYIHIEESTLANWRSYGTGPKWRKHGGHVVYARATLDQWSEQQR